ncbi:MAG: hypothetical protein ACLPY5_09220 [Candidatus Bathyarchaeia archaeon]
MADLEEYERKRDDDYVRVVDGLARFFNSQNASHAGYLLTMVVIYLVYSNIVMSSFSWVDNTVVKYSNSHYIWPITAACLLFGGFFVLVYTFRWGIARLQYYIALSEVALDHLPYTASFSAEHMERYYEALKERAIGQSPSSEILDTSRLGVRNAILRLFEARLYLSCKLEKNPKDLELNAEEQKPFQLSNFYRVNLHLGRCYHKRKVLKIWKQTRLLLRAHRKTLQSYEQDPADSENRAVWDLFKKFLK